MVGCEKTHAGELLYIQELKSLALTHFELFLHFIFLLLSFFLLLFLLVQSLLLFLLLLFLVVSGVGDLAFLTENKLDSSVLHGRLFFHTNYRYYLDV